MEQETKCWTKSVLPVMLVTLILVTLLNLGLLTQSASKIPAIPDKGSPLGIDRSLPMVMLEHKSYRDGELTVDFPLAGLVLCGSKGHASYLTPGSVQFRDFDGVTGDEQYPKFIGCKDQDTPWYLFSVTPFTEGEVSTLQPPQIDHWEEFLYGYANEKMRFDAEQGNEQERTFTLNGQEYTVRFQVSEPYGYQITLYNGHQKQVLIHRNNTVNAFAGIEWAGDLDKDGKLDLILNYTDGGGYSSEDYFANSVTMLFLSSLAKNTALVMPAAKHVASTGC